MPEEDYGRRKVLDSAIDEDHVLASIDFTEEDHNVPILNYKSVADVQADPDYVPYNDKAQRANRMSIAAEGMISAGCPMVLMTSDFKVYQAKSFWGLTWLYFKSWVRR